jgi:hypothetical protein
LTSLEGISEIFGESRHCLNLKCKNLAESQLKMVGPELIWGILQEISGNTTAYLD